jgi:hypothetical protein
MKIPGEASAIVTILDGHAIARQGRAGIALGISAIASFIAGTIATIVMAAAGRPLAGAALMLGPSDLFSIMVFGLLLAVVLSQGSVLKGIAMVLVGLALATVGRDIETGEERFTFGFGEIDDGIEFSVLAVGLFGFAEILRNLDRPEAGTVVRSRIARLLPSLEEMRRSALPILRGTLIGGVLGVLPGNGAVLGPFASYALEKKLARDPSRFGHGAIEGVAAPEASNNAAAQTSLSSTSDIGSPGQRSDGAHDRRDDYSRGCAGSTGDDERAAAVLGPGRLDVDRKLAFATDQFAVDFDMGSNTADSLSRAISDHPAHLLYRHLYDQQCSVRYRALRNLWSSGARLTQDGIRTDAPHAGLCSWSPHGRELSSQCLDFGRRLERIRHEADLGRLSSGGHPIRVCRSPDSPISTVAFYE